MHGRRRSSRFFAADIASYDRLTPTPIIGDAGKGPFDESKQGIPTSARLQDITEAQGHGVPLQLMGAAAENPEQAPGGGRRLLKLYCSLSIHALTCSTDPRTGASRAYQMPSSNFHQM
jgi:hypothetical protein